jgi:predicted metal-dependent phosphoesterase TrpH
MDMSTSTDSPARYPVDLHVHTNASDGTDAPAELVAKAKAAGMLAVGITDHDSVSGVPEALEAGRRLGVQVVAGVELSLANDPAHGAVEMHLLGYFIDPDHPALKATIQRMMAARVEQKLAIVRNLQKLGFDVPEEEILALAGQGVPGRMHIAQVVMRRNPGRIPGPEVLFREYISEGGKAYVERSYQLSLEEGIRVIREAGGMPVLAHPGAYTSVPDIEGFIRSAVALGLAGLEGPYPYDKNRPFCGKGDMLDAMIGRFTALAESLGLAVTGGSDYHGARKNIALGEQGLTAQAFERLLAVREALAERK